MSEVDRYYMINQDFLVHVDFLPTYWIQYPIPDWLELNHSY